MIAGLLRLAGGQLALAGGDPDKTIAEQAHYLGHQDALKPSLTVAENLAFWARYLGGAEPPEPALAAVGLAALADLPAAYLSAGQRRRLSLARLVAVPRPIWLLDEPTSALDREAQDALGGLDAAAPRRRRPDRRGDARAARARTGQGAAARRSRMSPLSGAVHPRRAARDPGRRRRAASACCSS